MRCVGPAWGGSRMPPKPAPALVRDPPPKCAEIHMMARAMHFRQAPCGLPVRELRLWHNARRSEWESPRYAPMPQRSSSVGSHNRVAGEALPRREPDSPSTRPLGLRFGVELQLQVGFLHKLFQGGGVDGDGRLSCGRALLRRSLLLRTWRRPLVGHTTPGSI